MSGSKRLRQRRERLWKKDPFCKLCGKKTILPLDAANQYGAPKGDIMRKIPDEVRDLIATIDHMVTRFDPRRHVKENIERTRLVCWKCNWQRGKDEYEALPIEERRRRSEQRTRVAWVV